MKNGHHFHKCEAVNKDKLYTFTYNNEEYTYDNFEDAYQYDLGEIPSFYCPICNMKAEKLHVTHYKKLRTKFYRTIVHIRN